jgi:hypothetical protein
MAKQLTYEQFVEKISRYDRKHYKAQELKEQYPEYYAKFFEAITSFATKLINDIEQQSKK